MSTERNKITVRRLFEESFSGDLAIIDEVFAPDYRGHNPPSEGAEAMVGPESQRAFVSLVLGSFAGIRLNFDDLIAEGSTVAARLTFNAVFQNPLGNIPATGQPFSHSYNIIFHFNDAGQIVEEWIERDTVQFLQILGVFPQPAA